MDAKDAVIEQQAECIKQLRQELDIIRRQLQQFQGKQLEEIAAHRRAARRYYREEYERIHDEEPFTCSGGGDVIDSLG